MEDTLSDLPHTEEIMKCIIDWMNSLDDEIRATSVRGKEQHWEGLTLFHGGSTDTEGLTDS